MRWQDKITKKELVHLREMGITTLGAARRSAEYQKSLRDNKQWEGFGEPCWDCRHIMEKLGLPI